MKKKVVTGDKPVASDKNLGNHNTIRLLRKLSDEEWVRFERFASSPFFNEGRNYLPLLKALKPFHPEFTDVSFTKKRIYESVYGKGNYSESAINSMLSRLYRIGEDFLLQLEFENDDGFHREVLRLRALRERELYQKAEKVIEESVNELCEHKFDEDFFLRRKRFARELAQFRYHTNRRSELFGSLTDLLRDSVYSFLIELFANDFSVYTQKNFWTSDYRESYAFRLLSCIDVDKMLCIIEEGDRQNYLFFRISCLMARSINESAGDENYRELKSLVYGNLDRFEHKFRKTALNILALICSAKFVRGDKRYRKEAFEIRKKVVEEGLFSMTSGKNILLSEFRSTFIEALNEGEYDWAESFADKYIERLQPGVIEDVKKYCGAMLAFYRIRLDDAVLLAGQVNINQIVFKLDMKNLIAKAYYDTASVESLLSHLQSYSQFIRNSASGSREHLTRHSNYVKFLKKLISLKMKDSGKAELSLLRDEVASANVAAKHWLLPRIEELMNSSAE